MVLTSSPPKCASDTKAMPIGRRRRFAHSATTAGGRRFRFPSSAATSSRSVRWSTSSPRGDATSCCAAATGYALALDLRVGAELVRSALNRATGADRRQLAEFADALEAAATQPRPGAQAVRRRSPPTPSLRRLMAKRRSLGAATTSRTYHVEVERERARFSTWYELFPRSSLPRPRSLGHVRRRRRAARLRRRARLRRASTCRRSIPSASPREKGRDGSSETTPDDPGSPWAIGSAKGGHTAVNRDLGTLTDFKRLVRAAKHRGLEMALDLAYQCSPDHPWVTRASELVQAPARRHDPDGGEPSEALRGRLSARLLDAGLATALEGAPRGQ